MLARLAPASSAEWAPRSITLPFCFESLSFKLKNGDSLDGFVVKEGGDSVEVRNLVGATTVIEKGDIVERQKRDQSIMPEGLVANITTADLASLIAYLESTDGK